MDLTITGTGSSLRENNGWSGLLHDSVPSEVIYHLECYMDSVLSEEKRLCQGYIKMFSVFFSSLLHRVLHTPFKKLWVVGDLTCSFPFEGK